ncbi:MAG: hypothetical protein LBC44_04930 [Mycoplasmataceae bacterium]|jgi:hypothetical protein|nr:hypothetical protein [Mycoplasmataceae bacterium]
MVTSNSLIFQPNIAKNIAKNIALKTPGVDAKTEVEVEVDEVKKQIIVVFKPLNYIMNVYDVSLRVQKAVAAGLVKQFDLSEVYRVNVKAA